MAQISLQKIEKSFGSTSVLKGVSLDIAEGEFVTLVGPSGCGKSTLLRILSGLEHADGGRVEINGTDVTNIRPADRDLAMVFQSYALYPHLSVADNMMTPLRMRELGAVARLPIIGPLVARKTYRSLRSKVEGVAKTLEISALLDRRPGQLSGGQRQRVALGRAMVREPVAFLMDEPLSNLDAALRVHMRAELSELHRRLKTTFVYVTHDQAEALTMSDRMAVMMKGRILQLGPPDKIYTDPETIEVARFIGSPAINILAGDVHADGRLDLWGETLGVLPKQVAQPVSFGLRPEHGFLSESGRFRGIVKHRENLGADIFLHIGVHGQDKVIVLRSEPARAQDMGIGANIQFDFDRTQMLIFSADGNRLRPPVATREVA
ncbi:ABC transporter ATP-binding protein [Tropicimonas sp. S265A]|uniref:ABC transporter ATP-binding protein n=1 Tax=Tropicimonas sp. S265A TaxID=3415134 RepID=UPI003C7BD602